MKNYKRKTSFVRFKGAKFIVRKFKIWGGEILLVTKVFNHNQGGRMGYWTVNHNGVQGL